MPHAAESLLAPTDLFRGNPRKLILTVVAWVALSKSRSALAETTIITQRNPSTQFRLVSGYAIRVISQLSALECRSHCGFPLDASGCLKEIFIFWFGRFWHIQCYQTFSRCFLRSLFHSVHRPRNGILRLISLTLTVHGNTDTWTILLSPRRTFATRM